MRWLVSCYPGDMSPANAKVVYIAMSWLCDLSCLDRRVRQISSDLYDRADNAGGDAWQYTFDDDGSGAPDLAEVTFDDLTLDEMEVIYAGLAGMYYNGPDTYTPEEQWADLDPHPREVLRMCMEKAAEKLVHAGRPLCEDGYRLWQ